MLMPDRVLPVTGYEPGVVSEWSVPAEWFAMVNTVAKTPVADLETDLPVEWGGPTYSERTSTPVADVVRDAGSAAGAVASGLTSGVTLAADAVKQVGSTAGDLLEGIGSLGRNLVPLVLGLLVVGGLYLVAKLR